MMIFFNDTATTEIYTLSLHDALPISNAAALGIVASSSARPRSVLTRIGRRCVRSTHTPANKSKSRLRSEEHTSELQSRQYLVCRLLLEKKNTSTYPLFRRYMSTQANS